MPLLLVPYNDTMRFGMGYNSYTQTMCIDSAVEASEEDTVTSKNLPQKVVCSAKLIERVSDLVDDIDVSRAATIQNGAVEVHGVSNSFDMAQIEDADVSLMISVKVINQTISLNASAPFKPIDGLLAGSPGFTKAFGDSYISGFVRGGFFVLILPISCCDLKTKESVIRVVKLVSFSKVADLPNIAATVKSIWRMPGVKTEMAIVLTGGGGGQIQGHMHAWDMSPFVTKAKELLSQVATNPQTTWAILTKYEANRGFIKWSATQTRGPASYSGVVSYTSQLFESYMKYKGLIRKVQHIISHQDQYSQVNKPRAIPLESKTLLAVRDALDSEIDKIVSVVNALALQPELLPKKDLESSPKDKLVQSIIAEALSLSEPEEIYQTQDHVSLYDVADCSPSETSGGFEGIYTPQCSDADSASLPGRSTLSVNRWQPFNDLKLHLLVSPEVWTELLPQKTEAMASVIEKSTKTGTATTERANSLQIMAAVCEVYDVTSIMQEQVFAGHDPHVLQFPIEKIGELESCRLFARLTNKKVLKVSIVYKYADGPMRVCSVDHDQHSTELCVITQKSKHQRVEGFRPHSLGLKLLTVVYGGKIYHSPDDLERFYGNSDCNSPSSWPCIQFNENTVGDDYSGTGDTTGVVFYEYVASPGVQSAVSLGGAGCLLKNQRRLVDLAQEEDTRHARNKDFDRQTVGLHKDIAAPVYTCTFKGGSLTVRPSESPFLQFENGVKFFFRNNGTFEVYDADGVVAWSNEGKFKCESARLLEFGRDGKLRLWNAKGQMYWAPVQGQIRRDGTIVFSSKVPYLQICDSNKQGLWWCA